MTQVPAERDLSGQDLLVRATPAPVESESELSFPEIWAAVVRNRWLILLSIATMVGLAAFLTSRATPVYQASATLKIEQKEPNLPGIFKSLSDNGELGTEAQVLTSRTLAEGAVDALGLQLRVVEPRDVARDELFDSITVTRTATPARYTLTRRANGGYEVRGDSTPQPIATVAPGQRVSFTGVSFRLAQGAKVYPTIIVQVQAFDQAALALLGALSVDPAGRNVNILTIDYQDTDPSLVWQVPNAIVTRYLERRREVAKAEARSTVGFLRQQLDTVSAQLATAEDALRDYRQRNRVIDPESEATSQVHRLVSMQSDRASIDAERTALSKLLADVDAKAARVGPGDPSPYRELVAFPTLLRSQIATGLLQSLSAVEQERTELLSRRNPNDPDVLALNDRLRELQTQLRAVVVTYLQGLGNQVSTLDSGLQQFGQQLVALPRQELQVARLERKPKVLDEIATLLQTRLKEAEIAQAAGDPSVQVLDPAAPPRRPFKPNRTVNLIAGLLGGLVLGGLTTFVREYRDRTVHTRDDIQSATGLPVLGLIPTIGGPRWPAKRIALIAEKQKKRLHAGGTPPPARPARPAPPQASDQATPVVRSTYTFLGAAGAGDVVAHEEPAKGEEPVRPAVPQLNLTFTEAGNAVAEAYGILQTNIAFSLPHGPARTVVVTSALPAEGKTTSAVNLALSLARRDVRVLLIDADLRRGAVHAAFEANREPGLTEVLRDAVPLARACHRVEIEGHVMHFLTAGASVSSPTALLESEAMRGLLARLREEYDVTILDSPPTNIVTDAAVLGAMADGVIVVARAGMTESAALGSAMDLLHHVRAPVLGVVLNDIDFKRDVAYDATYRYYNPNQYLSSTPS